MTEAKPSMERSRPAWTLREATSADREGILALRNRVFVEEDPEKRDPRFWDWEFAENHAGRARLFVADDGGRIVGHYAIIPQEFAVDGETVAGSIVVDVMTDPDYRFQGMFKKIGQFSLGAVEGPIAFATGYPIRKEVMPGHLSIGWIVNFKIPVLVRPLRWSALARKYRIPGAALADVIPAPWRFVRRLVAGSSREYDFRTLTADDCDAVAEVSAAALSGTAVHQKRTPGYLRWRYFTNPRWKYELTGAFHQGKLVAYLVAREAMLLSTPSLALADFGAREREEHALRALINRATDDGIRRGLAVAGAMTTTGSAAYRALRRCGFHPGPHKFSLILYFIDSKVSAKLRRGPEDWFLTWGDTDDI